MSTTLCVTEIGDPGGEGGLCYERLGLTLQVRTRDKGGGIRRLHRTKPG